LIWKVEWDDRARKELRKLDPQFQKKILNYMRKHICSTLNPRRLDKSLNHDKSGLWRYRVGDYWIICKIDGDCVVVLVLVVGPHIDVYK
jgi:mRNA interferase RelE/StbE